MRTKILAPVFAAALALATTARAQDPERLEEVLDDRADAEHNYRIGSAVAMSVIAVGSIPGVILVEDDSLKYTFAAIGLGSALSVPFTLLGRGPHEHMQATHRRRKQTMSPDAAARATAADWQDKAETERTIRLVSGGIGLAVGVIVCGGSAVYLATREKYSDKDVDAALQTLGVIGVVLGGTITISSVFTLALPGPIERSWDEVQAGTRTQQPTLTTRVPGLSVSGRF